MKFAFDTNIILDALVHREGWEAAERLMLAVGDEEIEGVVSANTITDIYYISRKRLGDQEARKAIWSLMSAFEVAGVDERICREALALPMNDFEDAVLAVAVKHTEANFIVTRDEEFIASEHTPVFAISPQKAIELIEGEKE